MKKNFRRFTVAFAAVTILLGLAPFTFAAEEATVTGEAAVSFLSAYIWRGQELSRHSAVIQPSMTVNYRGFSMNLWGNLDTGPYSATDEKYSSNFTETDLTVSYSRKFGILQAGAGYIYYALAAPYTGASDPADSQELFITLGLDTLLAPTLTVYKEIDHYQQWYALLGVSHTFALHEKIGLTVAATASYLKSEDATTYPAFDSSALPTDEKFSNFHDATVSVSLPIAVTKSLTIKPVITYVFPLSDDARYEMRGRGLKGSANPEDKNDYFIYGGISASFAF
jgi:hypothetical protein